MLIIGLTGGIGSGKSTAANYFKQLNIDVISADTIAHSLVEPNKPAHQKIIDHFGTVDRHQLRELIFNDPKAKEWLEQCLHPLIKEEIIHTLPTLSSSYIVIEIPLLFETGPYNFINRNLVIDCDESTQIERTHQRTGMNTDNINKIIASQITRKKRLALADDVINNNGNKKTLKNAVETLHQTYIQISQAKH